MKLRLFSTLFLLMLSTMCFAVDGYLASWSSKDNSDTVTVQNGTGLQLIISISVDKKGVGINIKNCGTTNHIDAGSTAVCASRDPANPVNFSSDTGEKEAMGTYEIKYQPPQY